MKLKTTFNYQGKIYTFNLNTENADRNYPDEPYMYWLVPVPGAQKNVDGECPFFEINLWKEFNDCRCRGYSLSQNGCVFKYNYTDDMAPAWEQDITFEYDNSSADAYSLMVRLGEIQNDFARGDKEISPEEIDEMYDLAVNLNEFFDNLMND